MTIWWLNQSLQPTAITSRCSYGAKADDVIVSRPVGIHAVSRWRLGL